MSRRRRRVIGEAEEEKSNLDNRGVTKSISVDEFHLLVYVPSHDPERITSVEPGGVQPILSALHPLAKLAPPPLCMKGGAIVHAPGGARS